MGTTRQRQRLLINGLVTVFLLSLLGGCEMQPQPKSDGSNQGGNSQQITQATTTPDTTTAPEHAPEQSPDILGLKAELEAIKKLVFDRTPKYVAAKEKLTTFQQSFETFSETYKGNNELKPQIDKISDLLKDVNSYLDDSELQKIRPEFDAKLQPIFDDLTSGLDSFNHSSETPLIATTTNQNETGEKPTETPVEARNNPEGDRQSELTFGQVIFANFLATGFTILLVVGIMKVSAEISNQRLDGRRKSNNPVATNPQANTLPQQNNLDSGKNIDALTAEFNKLYSLISGLQEYSIKKGELTSNLNSIQTTLNTIQGEIKNIPRSISESVGRTPSYDSPSVQSYLNQINSLKQEKENKDYEIKRLQEEKRGQSDEIRDLKAQLNRLSYSHTNAVSSVQYKQLEQRFNDLSQEYETLKTTYNNLEQSIRNNNAANQGKLEESKQQLTVVQQKLDQVTSDLTEVTAERDGLQDKLDKLEEKEKKLKHRQKINDNSYPTTSTGGLSNFCIGKESNSSSSSPLPADIQRLVNDYNQNPKSLQGRQLAAVEFTEKNYDAFRSGSPAILEYTKTTGAYWVVTSISDSWLFPPDTKLKHTGDYYTLSALYECDQYQENLTKKFTLIKPAKVSNLGSNQWRLIEKGQLEFTG